MTRTLKLCFLTALFALAAYSQDSTDETSGTGRYKLMRGTVTIVVDRVRSEVPCVFKLDSATGHTWIYESVLIHSNLSIGWRPIADLDAPLKSY